MAAKKKKEYLPLFKMLGGQSKGYDIGEGEQEGYWKPVMGEDEEEEEEDTGWRGNLSGLCSPPVYQFPKAKGKQHPVSTFSCTLCVSESESIPEGDVKDFLLHQPFGQVKAKSNQCTV